MKNNGKEKVFKLNIFRSFIEPREIFNQRNLESIYWSDFDYTSLTNISENLRNIDEKFLCNEWGVDTYAKLVEFKK